MATTLRKQRTHSRIVDVASRAIRRSGSRGIRVIPLMQEAGLTHGGFYEHFQSRDALLLEAIEHAGKVTLSTLVAAIERSKARGGDAFGAVVRTYLGDKRLEEVECSCTVAALAAELHGLDKASRNSVRECIHALVALVRSTLPPDSTAGQTELITCTLVGTLQLARTAGGDAGRTMLRRARRQLLRQVQYPGQR